jgi:hypothetical protein
VPTSPSSRRSAASKVKRSGTARQRSGHALLRRCNIVETTVLALPNRAALALVKVGDVLQVEFRPGPPPLLVAMTRAGTAAGAIDCASRSQIAACIQLGVNYVAKVLLLSGSSCKVRVQPRELLWRETRRVRST